MTGPAGVVLAKVLENLIDCIAFSVASNVYWWIYMYWTATYQNAANPNNNKTVNVVVEFVNLVVVLSARA